MIKRKTFAVAILVYCAYVSSCDENKSPSTSGPLGEIPKLIYESEIETDNLLSKLKNTTDKHKATAIAIESENINRQKAAAIVRMAGTLEGKTLNSDVAANVPIRLEHDFRIENVDARQNKLMLMAPAKLTSTGTYLNNGSAFQLSDIRIVVYDADGNPFYTNTASSFRLDKDIKFTDIYPTGTKGCVTIAIRIKKWNAAQMGNLGRIVVSTKDREDYQQALKTEKDAKDIHDRKMNENNKSFYINIQKQNITIPLKLQ